MSQGLASSVPGVYAALIGLVEEAAGEQSEPIAVFPFELKQYEPATYILLGGIKGPRYEWESIGYYSQTEKYEIHGKVATFTGASGEKAIAVAAIANTYAAFNACVMSPVISNRNEPILGTEGPSPYLVLPDEAQFSAGVGLIDNGPAGWQTTLDWSFHFEAYLTPAEE